MKTRSLPKSIPRARVTRESGTTKTLTPPNHSFGLSTGSGQAPATKQALFQAKIPREVYPAHNGKESKGSQ